MLLAIDTSTNVPSIALFDERGIVGETTWRTHENHTRSLMPEVVRLMELVGTDVRALKAIGVATGPGSFTGLRIGLSAAKGLAYSLNVALIGVPTLDVAASAVAGQGQPVCALLQAGRERFGAAIYQTDAGTATRVGDYFFGTAQELAAEARTRVRGAKQLELIGEMSDAVRAEFSIAFGDFVVIAGEALNPRRAGFLAALAWQRWRRGDVDDLQTLAPYYIPTPSVRI